MRCEQTIAFTRQVWQSSAGIGISFHPPERTFRPDSFESVLKSENLLLNQSARTRFVGKLEGVSEATRSKIFNEAKTRGVSVH
jgi:hypothetical protein